MDETASMTCRCLDDRDRAIASSYEAFERYGLRRRFEERCSPLGPRREIARTLSARPLSELDARPLEIYCFKAMLTMGDVDDFRYFLPRMIELYAKERDWRLNGQDMFRKLEHAKFREWAPTEREAIFGFIEAMWRCVLCCPDETRSVAAYLDDIAYAGVAPGPFLESFHISVSLESATRAASFVSEACLSLHERVRDAAKPWIVKEEVVRKLEAAAQHAEGSTFEALYWALERIAHMNAGA
jgi:hypothetical protein